jgi:putative acetyltransferase
MRAEAEKLYWDVLDGHTPPPAYDPKALRSAYLVAWLGDEPVGCAALAPMDDEVAEVRRVYVIPSARRRGVARRLVVAVERRAAEFGYRTPRLETGTRQPGAIALYGACGFHGIPPYGVHVTDLLSVCFEKAVAGD